MNRLLPALVLPLLLSFAFPAFAQDAADAPPAEAPPTEPEAQDVERVIETLEDPEARAELVRELRVLLEAERLAAAEAEEPPLPTGTEMVEAITDFLTETWETIQAIDPMQLLASIGLSLLILLGALIVRALILRLLRRVYERLIGSKEDAEGGAGPDGVTGPPAEDRVLEMAESAPDAETHEEASEAEAALERGELPAAIVRLINLIVAVIAVALIAETWGAGVASLLQTDLGSRIIGAGLGIGVILVVTMVAWHVSGLVVARLLALAGSARDEERRVRRVNTLVPLLRSVLQGIIGVLAGLLILSELGVNIAPLLAGAGILGIAVGFGAQSLVKDLLTGVTILLEDGATVGDVVEVAGHAGVVEEMRVRLIRLRDLSGAVHFIPYSEVTTIINFTKDFSYALLEVGIAYRENTDEVCELLTEVTDDLRADPEYRFDILEPLEILGVDKFADSAVVIKCRIKTPPGRQWAIGRAFNRRMKLRFDERGIEIPFPHTTVYFGEPKKGPAPPARLAIVDGKEEAR